MAERIRSDSLVALGKKLVDQLGLEQSVDTLGRWMAHYVAEKMEAAESATGDARSQKMTECRDAILELWAHRRNLPTGQRPFDEFEQIFRVLQTLDLDDPLPRYFRQPRIAAAQDEESDSTKEWLDKAAELDNTARALIRYCLSNAAQEAVDKTRDWVALAESAAVGKEIDIRAIRAIVEDGEDLIPENPDSEERTKMEDLLTRLEAFTAVSASLSLHLRGKLPPTGS